ncbi:MAG: M20/M25/M40 family metallo-hydrolase [Hymenobacteraceae bacterium]|nr:M20/M25/M40 family metallo-hydrolase [Hymenobacteraceae bacterium]MDX5395539.1 M20/M25/M40 family metallo-hydrolase [Hymenobacteraceae bacterium]MDX5511593.1 M20/M25/M40 family metallo-hydrolase [Hymenobacteraceae bacterium]
MQQQRYLPVIFLLLALTGIGWLSIKLWEPPAAVPATAPATAFSAERAMTHVRQIAREPHAMGTAAHARVRRYLLAELNKLNLDTMVQEETVCYTAEGAVYAGHVYNILGRLSGYNQSGKAVLLMAHYDSQPNTLGAGDDAAGVAAILETVRALQQEGPLQNDVIVLLTDGEEYGLYGAQAFLNHPWAEDVGVVLNLEARGNSGASNTFEISPENGKLMKIFAKVAPYPLAASLMYEVYRLMPNDTDFSVLRRAGYSGFNSAFIDGFVHYHKLTDSPENLNQNSLQHHGSNMLALAKYFAKEPYGELKAPDKVFFNPAGYWMVQYPKPLNWVWLVLSVVLLWVVWLAAVRQGVITAKQGFAGLGAIVLLLAITVGLFFPINMLVHWLLPYTRPINGVYQLNLFFLAYLLLALGFFLLLAYGLLRRLSVWALQVGAYLLWLLLGLVVQFFIPSASYVFLVPLFFCLIGALLVLVLRQYRRPGWPFALVLLVSVVPALFMLMPVVRMLLVVFALNLPQAMVALLLLLASLMLQLLVFIEKSYRIKSLPALPLVLLLAGLVQLVVAIQKEKPGPEQPLHSHVSYVMDTDSNRAWWVSDYSKPDEWNKQFFSGATTYGTLSELYPHAQRRYLKANAQPLNLEAPQVTVLEDYEFNNQRIVQLRLQSERDAQHLEVLLQPDKKNGINSIVINDKICETNAVQTPAGPAYYLMLHGLPQNKSAELHLYMQPGTKLNLWLYDQSIGLPQQLVKQPRPSHVIPEQGRFSNLTVVRKKYQF